MAACRDAVHRSSWQLVVKYSPHHLKGQILENVYEIVVLCEAVSDLANVLD